MAFVHNLFNSIEYLMTFAGPIVSVLFISAVCVALGALLLVVVSSPIMFWSHKASMCVAQAVRHAFKVSVSLLVLAIPVAMLWFLGLALLLALSVFM